MNMKYLCFFFFPSKRTGLNPPTDWFWAAGRMLDTPCLKQRNVLLIIRSTFAGFFFYLHREENISFIFDGSFFFFFLSQTSVLGGSLAFVARAARSYASLSKRLWSREGRREERRRGEEEGGRGGSLVWVSDLPVIQSKTLSPLDVVTVS